MKRSLLLSEVVGLCFCIVMTMVGCDGSGGDDGDEARGTDSVGGTSTIRGNISSFEMADATFEPIIPGKKSLLSRFASVISEALVPCAYAAGNREGIIIYLDGPVSRSTTTADDGTFAFSDLPAGAYTLSFEYDGEEVRYRGNSGQVPVITVEENQIVELLNLRISGGKVNIGNIKVIKLDDDDDDDDDDDGDESE